MERRWSESWNLNEPIENIFDRLEDCYVQSITQPPAYTAEQMVDKALTAIQLTGLFPTAILEWNGFDVNHQTWPEFKSNPIFRKHRYCISNPADSTGTIHTMARQTHLRTGTPALRRLISQSRTSTAPIMQTQKPRARKWQLSARKWQQPGKQWSQHNNKWH